MILLNRVILAAATTRFEALSGNLKATADQMAQLKAQHDAAQRTIALLTSERDALSARLTTLQAEFQDAATRHAPPVELLPFARRVLELSSQAGTLPRAQLQSPSCAWPSTPSPPPKVPPLPLLPHLLLLPACRYCSPCYATAHSANADPTAAASSHPAATGTADATTADRRRADGAHVYAHARRRTDTRRTGRTERQCCRRPARREKSQHRQGRSETRKGAGIPCHPQHHRHRQTRQMGR